MLAGVLAPRGPAVLDEEDIARCRALDTPRAHFTVDCNAKALEASIAELATITGQKVIVTRAKKAIAGFKIRAGMPIGVAVTLRGERMYAFLERLIHLALPRIRDFRGVPTRLSGHGDYTLGLKDQLVFPEINYAKVDESRGMNVTIVTSAKNDEEGRELLRLMGMPFRR